MIEGLITRLANRIKDFFSQAKVFKIKANIVMIVSVYFICVLLTQLFYGLVNLNYTLETQQIRDKQTVSHFINQAAIKIRLEL